MVKFCSYPQCSNYSLFPENKFKDIFKSNICQCSRMLECLHTIKQNINNLEFVIPQPRAEVFHSDIVLKVNIPSAEEVPLFREGNTLFSFVYPARNKDIVDMLAQRKATVFGMECVPRISRAQVFDALSSMANISGYKAVIEAANHFGRFFTGS